jgi:hypothetical protein
MSCGSAITLWVRQVQIQLRYALAVCIDELAVTPLRRRHECAALTIAVIRFAL